MPSASMRLHSAVVTFKVPLHPVKGLDLDLKFNWSNWILVFLWCSCLCCSFGLRSITWTHTGELVCPDSALSLAFYKSQHKITLSSSWPTVRVNCNFAAFRDGWEFSVSPNHWDHCDLVIKVKPVLRVYLWTGQQYHTSTIHIFRTMSRFRV